MLVVNEHGSRMGTPKNGQLILKIDLNLWAPMSLILSHTQITNLTTSWAAQKSSQVVPGFLSSLSDVMESWRIIGYHWYPKACNPLVN